MFDMRAIPTELSEGAAVVLRADILPGSAGLSLKPTLPAWSDDEAAFGAFAAAAMRQAPSFFGVCDAQFRVRFLNAAGREMVGLSANADVTAFRIADFFKPEHRARVEDVILPTMLQDGVWSGELCFCHLTDPAKRTAVRWSIFPLRDDAGTLFGAAAFTTDIVALHPTVRALQEQWMLLASVLDNLPLGVGVYDHSGNLTQSNQRMRDYAGLTRLPSHDPSSLRAARRCGHRFVRLDENRSSR